MCQFRRRTDRGHERDTNGMLRYSIDAIHETKQQAEMSGQIRPACPLYSIVTLTRSYLINSVDEIARHDDVIDSLKSCDMLYSTF